MSMRHPTVLAPLLILLALSTFGCGQGDKASDKPEPASRFANFGGIKVHYLDFNPGPDADKEPLVLVHGWSCDADFWRAQAEHFGKKRRVLAVDLPGHGKSDAPEITYDLDLFARAVEAAMRDAGVDRAVLAGHSMGAPVIRRAARLFPDKADGLVLADGAFLIYPETEPAKTLYKQELDKFTAGFHSPDYKKYTEGFVTSMFSERTAPETREFILKTMTSMPEHVMAGSMDTFTDEKNWLVPPMDKPTLAVYAKGGSMNEEFKRHIKEKFPNSTYVEWEGHGHFLMLEDPARFNKELQDFLRRFDANRNNPA